MWGEERRVEKDDSIWCSECLETGVSQQPSKEDSNKKVFDYAEVESIDAC